MYEPPKSRLHDTEPKPPVRRFRFFILLAGAVLLNIFLTWNIVPFINTFLLSVFFPPAVHGILSPWVDLTLTFFCAWMVCDALLRTLDRPPLAIALIFGIPCSLFVFFNLGGVDGLNTSQYAVKQWLATFIDTIAAVVAWYTGQPLALTSKSDTAEGEIE
jgi:hypothetical protein